MLYFILVVLAVTVVALIVRTERLARQVEDIEMDIEMDFDRMEAELHAAFTAVGRTLGALTVRADRFEAQLGGSINKASGPDVLAILDEAQAFAAANDPVPVVPGFVGFPQDYDPSYHFGGQQLRPSEYIGQSFHVDLTTRVEG